MAMWQDANSTARTNRGIFAIKIPRSKKSSEGKMASARDLRTESSFQNTSHPNKYSVTSTMTLTDAEIADGYVLACSCHPQSDLVLA